MGMSSSDDEQAIMEDYALLQWAREAPQQPGSYDYPVVSEMDQALYMENLKQWAHKKPTSSRKRGDDR